MRLQSSIGTVKYPGREDLDNTGQLIIGRVKRVNNKTHVAEVTLEQGSYVGPIKKGDEETVSCMRLENSHGWSDERECAYGRVTPLHEGQLVLVAYVDSMKKKPIIIGALSPLDNSLTNHPTVIADGEIEREKEEIYDVTKLQEYHYTTADGDFERVKANAGFITGRRDKMSDHRENGFTYDDLTIKNKWTYRTIRALKKFFRYKPFNYLIRTQNTFEDTSSTIYNRFYHDSEIGVTRASRDTENTLFYMELDNEFTIQQQRDSNRRPRKPYEQASYPHETLRESDKINIAKMKKPKPMPSFQPINDFTRIRIKENGELEVHYQQKGMATNIIIGQELSIRTTQPIDVHSNQAIGFYSSESFTAIAPTINIVEAGVPPCNPRKEDIENEWEQQWINPTQTNGDRV